MANIEEVLTNHAEQLQGKDVDSFYKNLNTELSALGYEVLINEKEKSEFIPSDRFNSTVAQRDQFRGQVDNLNKQLEELRKNSDNSGVQKQLQSMIDSNNNLTAELENARVDNEILMEARDAIDPKEILLFVSRDVAKINSKSQVVGAKEEVERIRTEKPHLFNRSTARAGRDKTNNDSGGSADINSMIRKAAGRGF